MNRWILAAIVGSVLASAAAFPALAACTPPTSGGFPQGTARLDTQTKDAISITGGCIDGVPIGANTPSTGSFTTLSTSAGTPLSATGAVSAMTGLTNTPLSMIHMRTAAGLMMTASASGTNFGLTYTPGTTAVLIGTATSSSTTGDTAALGFVLPPWYIAGKDITLKVGCYYTNTSSTASVHTMAAAAYLNAEDGTQGSTLIATGAQTCPITTSAQQTFTITGTTLVPGSLLTFTFTAAVTNGGGISTEWLTSVSLN